MCAFVRLFRLVAVLLAATAALAAGAQGAGDSFNPVRSEERVALVIGNGAYKSSPLLNPANDATDMAAALQLKGPWSI